MSKKVLKYSVADTGFEEMYPSKKSVPEWYKGVEKKHEGQPKYTSLPIPHTFKMCSPFLDSLLSGYMVPLPVDIAVDQTEAGPSISWNPNPEHSFLELRNRDTNSSIPTPHGFSDLHFVWKMKSLFKIPKGYSVLLTHPLNRFDLPFITLSGIIDGEFTLYGGSLPVFFNKDFKGIIPAGTPIAQVIPFKTESWKLERDDSITTEATLNQKKSYNAAYGWYKKNIWKKKTYE